MHAHEEDLHLERDVAYLTELLDQAIAELSGPAGLALVRSTRAAAVAARARDQQGSRARLAEHIAPLSVSELSLLARAFTLFFHLANVAEQHQRVRLLRRYERAAPAQDSLAAALSTLRAEGYSAAEVRAQLSRMFVMPVLTAHPTEARRRTLIHHSAHVRRWLDCLELPLGALQQEHFRQAVADSVRIQYGTQETRSEKPSPQDELESGLDVFRRTLFDATPAVYRELEARLAWLWPEADWLGLGAEDASCWPVPSFLRWGSWIGGDRDGNPFVTAHVTRAAFERQRALVLERHAQDVEALARMLSLAEDRVPQPAGLRELNASLTRDRERFPELAALVTRTHRREPLREKLRYMQARLRATQQRDERAYVDAAGHQRDLLLLERSLVEAGLPALARGPLRDARRRADVFGFHLASLDLRQHSRAHESAVAELLQALGHGGSAYTELAEAERVSTLQALLARPESLQPRSRAQLSAQTQDLLATLDMVGRARREQGAAACERYVVSFTSQLSDLLEVLVLQRAAGLAPHELKPVPLLEQLADLEGAATLAQQMLRSPPLRAAIGSELEVMLGYSDSCKQVGYASSLIAVRNAQHALADVAEQHGVLLTVFHGRGGAIGRGGGPSHYAIRAQPERALRGRIRVTEQGETIHARYGDLEVAQRDLEQVISAVLLSAASERKPVAVAELRARDQIFGALSRAALRAYAELLSDPERLVRYTQAATPIAEVAALPIGSRPASRKPGLSLADLRAIPWVFSWNQSRHGLPGFYGLGSGLQAVIEAHGLARIAELYRDSAFFRTLINNAQLALSRADIEVAALYAELADDDAQQLFPLIRAEWDRTVSHVLAIVDTQQLLANRPHILAAVQRRNPHVDVLNHVQIELLRRLAACDDVEQREALQRVLFTTISGIAAGLQTAG